MPEKRRANCKFTIEQEALMVSDYRMGATIKKICETYKCSREKVRQVLKTTGTKTRGRRKKNNE